MIDCHSHLCDEEFDEDRKAVVEFSLGNGVSHIVVASTSSADAAKVIEACSALGGLYPAMGVHPCFCLDNLDIVEATVMDHRKSLVAIGEVGLDFTPRALNDLLEKGKETWGFKSVDDVKERQRVVFDRMIDIGLALDLPLIVHSRYEPVLDSNVAV
mmetsp:Transcript_45742/g.118229  ORF Transcript_45742/g.118229 Transcript_45742/m.118229 type:complete len:157 (-) Transcript_45742:500-970(-)